MGLSSGQRGATPIPSWLHALVTLPHPCSPFSSPVEAECLSVVC